MSEATSPPKPARLTPTTRPLQPHIWEVIPDVFFIHFVAHATASKLSPLDPQLFYPASSSEQDSFKLYAREINTRNSTPSWSQSRHARGRAAAAYSGEGLVGLSWAFVRAGAHNVIGALWDVTMLSRPTLWATFTTA